MPDRTIVTYHVYVPESKEQELGAGIKSSDRSHVLDLIFREHNDEYEDLVSMLFASARLHYPGCHLAVLTDSTTKFERQPKDTEIRRYDFDSARLMHNRLDAQIDFLKSLKNQSVVLMLDSDILINIPPTVSDQDEDYAIILTTRPKFEAPINGGVFIISGKRRPEAIRFLERVAEIHRTVYGDLGAWGGNQFALRDAVKEIIGGEIPEEGDYKGIRLLPASLYNYTPAKGTEYRTLSKRRGEYLLHFKGLRKKVMKLYWDAFLGGGGLELLWSRIYLMFLSCKERIGQ